MNKRELSRHMSELGKIGAEARTKALSVERRKEIASHAAKVRWDEAKKLKFTKPIKEI